MAKKKSLKKWREFEEKVANAYRRVGATVEHDRYLAGNQIDIYSGGLK